jgi:hypothetical protein
VENVNVAEPSAAVEPAVKTETKNPVVMPEGTAPEGEETKQAEPEPRTFTKEEYDKAVGKAWRSAQKKAEIEIVKRMREHEATQRREAVLKPENFTSDDAYLEARLEQLAERKAAEKISQLERQREQEKVSEQFLERAEKASEKYPDFQQVAGNPNLPINEGMAEFIADSDAGPDVAYYLGKHPSEAAKIAQLSPIRAARELTRIEAELSNKPPVKTSNAPAPISPIGNRGAVQTSLANMDFAEYKKQRLAMNPSWRR